VTQELYQKEFLQGFNHKNEQHMQEIIQTRVGRPSSICVEQNRDGTCRYALRAGHTRKQSSGHDEKTSGMRAERPPQNHSGETQRRQQTGVLLADEGGSSSSACPDGSWCALNTLAKRRDRREKTRRQDLILAQRSKASSN
jgi:hypothetical protein